MNLESRRAVFAEVHKAIDEAAQSVIDCLSSDVNLELTYPPGIEISPQELEYLAGIDIAPEAKKILKKIIADACGYPVFHMMSLLDGVTEPYVIEIPEWFGGALAGDPDKGIMLHDEFFEAYWDYNNRKSD